MAALQVPVLIVGGAGAVEENEAIAKEAIALVTTYEVLGTPTS